MKPMPHPSQPALVNLSSWAAHRVTSPFRQIGNAVVLVGKDEATGSARVSSPIKRYDHKHQQAVTTSGRVYNLIETPGANLDAARAFGEWCRRWRVTSDTDISSRYARKPKAIRNRAA